MNTSSWQMMGGIEIIADSTSGFPRELYLKYGLSVLQLSVVFPKSSKTPEFSGVKNDLDIVPAKFYEYLERLGKKDALPTTSAPNIKDVTQVFDEAFEKGAEKIILFCLMSSKSATYNNALAAKNIHLMGDKIEVIDSCTIGPGIGFMAADAKKHSESHSFEDTVKYANSLKGNSTIFAVPKTLRFLHAGGRISNMENLIGILLKIRPVISIVKKDEKGSQIYDLQAITRKPRSLGQAIAAIEQHTKELAQDYYDRGLRIVDYGVCNTGDVIGANELDEVVGNALKSKGIKVGYHEIEDLPLVLTTHLGPSAFGVGFYGRKN
ncbi:MAG: DegV family protein [Candidatus Woesearchaeota archaeon]